MENTAARAGDKNMPMIVPEETGNYPKYLRERSAQVISNN